MTLLKLSIIDPINSREERKNRGRVIEGIAEVLRGSRYWPLPPINCRYIMITNDFGDSHVSLSFLRDPRDLFRTSLVIWPC